MSNLKCKSRRQNWNKNKATKISRRILTKLYQLLSLSVFAVSACLKMISIVNSCCFSLCFLVVTSFCIRCIPWDHDPCTSLGTSPVLDGGSTLWEFALLRNSVSKVKQMKVVRTNKLKCLSLTCRGGVKRVRARNVFIVTYVFSGYIINIH